MAVVVLKLLWRVETPHTTDTISSRSTAHSKMPAQTVHGPKKFVITRLSDNFENIFRESRVRLCLDNLKPSCLSTFAYFSKRYGSSHIKRIFSSAICCHLSFEASCTNSLRGRLMRCIAKSTSCRKLCHSISRVLPQVKHKTSKVFVRQRIGTGCSNSTPRARLRRFMRRIGLYGGRGREKIRQVKMESVLIMRRCDLFQCAYDIYEPQIQANERAQSQ